MSLDGCCIFTAKDQHFFSLLGNKSDFIAIFYNKSGSNTKHIDIKKTVMYVICLEYHY